ncbi:MAG: sugar porter family MFS transporter [Fibrobacterota bacterium]
MENRKLLYTLFISCVAAIGGFLFGYDSAVINGTVTAIQEVFDSSTAVSGFSVASMLLGCTVGALLAGNIADKVGRRPVMQTAALLFIVSAVGSGAVRSVTPFIFYRLIGGLAVGAASVIAPTYISEIAPREIRGRLASLQQLAIVSGIFAAFLVNYGIATSAGSSLAPWLGGFQAWQWMFWTEVIPAGLFFIFALIIPESPRFLTAAGKEDTARSVLGRLIPSERIEAALTDIRKSFESARKPRFTDIFSKGKVLPIVWIGIALSVFQQFVGINVVFYYGSVLWQAAGFAESQALLINVVSGVINIASTLTAISLIDKIGRKPLLIGGSLGMTLTLGIMAIVFATAGQSEAALDLTRSQAITALTAAHLYIFCFGVSWGPVVWVLLGEMFSNRIRGAAISTAAGAQWIANFLITMSFPVILASLGLASAYGLYAVFALLSLFFVHHFVQETKGKSLEEMKE